MVASTLGRHSLEKVIWSVRSGKATRPIGSVVPLITTKPSCLSLPPDLNFHSGKLTIAICISKGGYNIPRLRPKPSYMQRMRRRQSLFYSPSRPKELLYIPAQASTWRNLSSRSPEKSTNIYGHCLQQFYHHHPPFFQYLYCNSSGKSAAPTHISITTITITTTATITTITTNISTLTAFPTFSLGCGEIYPAR